MSISQMRQCCIFQVGASLLLIPPSLHLQDPRSPREASRVLRGFFVLSLQHCFLEPDEVARLVFELFLLDIHEIMQCEQSSEPQPDGYRKLRNDAQKSTSWSLTNDAPFSSHFLLLALDRLVWATCMGPSERTCSIRMVGASAIPC